MNGEMLAFIFCKALAKIIQPARQHQIVFAHRNDDIATHAS